MFFKYNITIKKNYKLIIINNERIKMDNRGYVMGGIAFLLIIPALILSNILISAVLMDNTMIIPFKSDRIHQLSGDVESDIPKFTIQGLNETSDMVSKTGEPVSNSRSTIKSRIQTKFDDSYYEYQKITGINVYCRINSVDNTKDPYKICVNSTLYINYNDSYLVKNLSQEVQLACSNSAAGYCKIKDPLPFIKTKGYGDITIEGDKIYYGTALSNYLRSKDIKNYEIYENASSPLYFKRCPYDPYHSHGHSNMALNLKNCIDNGYYHVSADGSCIFCRLEGKPVCGHVGLETFILPGNYRLGGDTAPCSVDHVIFGTSPVEIYNGKSIECKFNDTISIWMYLDLGHKNKYGLPID